MILPHETTAVPGGLLDLDMVRKYSMAGPRYTSYPPATRFTPDFDMGRIEAAIAADNHPGSGPLSLYFHLPFCESLCWYCGCNTVITRRRDSAHEYLADIERELILTAGRIRRGRTVTQVHLGGGTPTFFPPEELARLGLLIYEHFDLERGLRVRRGDRSARAHPGARRGPAGDRGQPGLARRPGHRPQGPGGHPPLAALAAEPAGGGLAAQRRLPARSAWT